MNNNQILVSDIPGDLVVESIEIQSNFDKSNFRIKLVGNSANIEDKCNFYSS